jgi:protoporphyrinogen oxidase
VKRRSFLGASGALVAGCDWASLRKQSAISGGFVGTSFARGHLLRDTAPPKPPTEQRKTTVAIVGAGISGLAAARALSKAGVSDYRLFELEDAAGGNSRGSAIDNIAHPLGAHYLPTPSVAAPEVRSLLTELGLLKVENGRDSYPEATLCHAPQERLLIDGSWQEGLLPAAAGATTSAQYTQFSQAVVQYQRNSQFVVPSQNTALSSAAKALEHQTFDAWLLSQGLDDPQLRWYLDYCCRDDYGAGSATVSAWAGIHYFASRHGFHPPGQADEKPTEGGVLTWPQGNGWLSAQLAAKYASSELQTAALVTRIAPERGRVTLDEMNASTRKVTRWSADHVILCTPLFIAAKLIDTLSTTDLSSLNLATQQIKYAPWSVANIYLPERLNELPGFPRSWDNVVYGSASLGYVDAQHQSTLPHTNRATVLTHYTAHGTALGARKALYEMSWESSAARVLAELSAAHPDIERKAKRVDITRYGHAMAVPTPGLRTSEALAALGKPQTGALARVHFAHSDLSAYSVFEEAFTWGTRVGARVARLISGR